MAQHYNHYKPIIIVIIKIQRRDKTQKISG